ncbi:MAG: hypothetical protein NC208_10305, partial [Bacteroides sp.]|nr:hypothetical protein [Bacteroides sp.]
RQYYGQGRDNTVVGMPTIQGQDSDVTETAFRSLYFGMTRQTVLPWERPSRQGETTGKTNPS